jgi:hypothetical protein
MVLYYVKEAEAIKQTAICMSELRSHFQNGKCAQCNYSGRFIIENFREERNCQPVLVIFFYIIT